VDYIVNFENAQNLLREATRDSLAFSMFLRASLQNPDLECKDLADFLIMPVQRIPRYPSPFLHFLQTPNVVRVSHATMGVLFYFTYIFIIILFYFLFCFIFFFNAQKYVMLLQDLFKNTPATHPDYANLVLACNKMREFADSINERKRSHRRIFQIKDCITGVKVLFVLRKKKKREN
jgi:RhoGEF domain